MPSRKGSTSSRIKSTIHFPVLPPKQKKGPSSTLLLFRAMTARKPDFRLLATQLSAIFRKSMRPVDASNLLKRFRYAWRARLLQNRGFNELQAAKRLGVNRSSLSIMMNDARFNLPPHVPRERIPEMAKKLRISEKEVRKLLVWRPER